MKQKQPIAPPQLIENPFFIEWAGQKPLGWAILGNPTINMTGEGVTEAIMINPLGDTDTAIMQRIDVVKGQRYYVRMQTGDGGDGEMVIRVPSSPAAGVILQQTFQGSVTEPFKTFVAPDSQIEILIRPTSGAISIINVTIRPFDVDPTPTRISVPKHPVFFVNAPIELLDALPSVNVINYTPIDPLIAAKLFKRGVLCLPRVGIRDYVDEHHPQLPEVEDTIGNCVVHYQNTCKGTLPGGADGLVIDEMNAWKDGDTEHQKNIKFWSDILSELRRLYPKKIIAVAGGKEIAVKSPSGLISKSLMDILAKYVDIFFLEIYQATADIAQVSYGRDLKAFKECADFLGEHCPALLRKTVVGLVTAENVRYNFARDAEYDFSKWLRVQLAHIPKMGRLGVQHGYAGVGQWLSSIAQNSTLIAYEQCIRETFLRNDRVVPLPNESDARQPIQDPSFEKGKSSSPWMFSGASDVSLYSSYPILLKKLHDGKVDHLQNFLFLTHDGAVPGAAQQDLILEVNSAYQLSVYTLPLTLVANATLKVLSAGKTIAKITERMYRPSTRWNRLMLSFVVPKGDGRVTIELTAADCGLNESAAYDFVVISQLSKSNAPLIIRGLSASNSQTSCVIIPLRRQPVTLNLIGDNFLPADIVRIGRDIYCDVEYVSDKSLRVLIPYLPEAGDYDITVSRTDWLGDSQAVTLQKVLKLRDTANITAKLVPVLGVLMG